MPTFSTAARLHRPAEFACALKGRRVARGDALTLTATRASDQVIPRLGLIVAKRHAKRAVTRNAIKRVLREAFRHQQQSLPPRDYIFRLHSSIPPQSLTGLKRQLRNQADALLQQAHLRVKTP